MTQHLDTYMPNRDYSLRFGPTDFEKLGRVRVLYLPGCSISSGTIFLFVQALFHTANGIRLGEIITVHADGRAKLSMP